MVTKRFERNDDSIILAEGVDQFGNKYSLFEIDKRGDLLIGISTLKDIINRSPRVLEDLGAVIPKSKKSQIWLPSSRVLNQKMLEIASQNGFKHLVISSIAVKGETLDFSKPSSFTKFISRGRWPFAKERGHHSIEYFSLHDFFHLISLAKMNSHVSGRTFLESIVSISKTALKLHNMIIKRANYLYNKRLISKSRLDKVIDFTNRFINRVNENIESLILFSFHLGSRTCLNQKSLENLEHSIFSSKEHAKSHIKQSFVGYIYEFFKSSNESKNNFFKEILGINSYFNHEILLFNIFVTKVREKLIHKFDQGSIDGLGTHLTQDLELP